MKKLIKEVKQIYNNNPTNYGILECIKYYREKSGKLIQESKREVEKILGVTFKVKKRGVKDV